MFGYTHTACRGLVPVRPRAVVRQSQPLSQSVPWRQEPAPNIKHKNERMDTPPHQTHTLYIIVVFVDAKYLYFGYHSKLDTFFTCRFLSQLPILSTPKILNFPHESPCIY